MCATNINHRVVVGFVVGVVVSAGLLFTSAASKASESDDQIKELLTQRLSVLVEIVNLTRQAHQSGGTSFDAVLAAEKEVLLAKLELASTADERIKIRESLVQLAGELEKLASHHVQAGQAMRADLLKAKALRLQAEADLLRERSSSGAANDDRVKGQDPAAKARAVVAEAEQRLAQVKGLSDKGIIPGADVDRAEIDLAEARVRLATAQGQQGEAVANLEKLVAVRERLWDHVKTLAKQGVIPASSEIDARIDLAEARIRLEWHTIAALRQQELDRVLEIAKRGLVSPGKVDSARKALEDSRHQQPGRAAG